MARLGRSTANLLAPVQKRCARKLASNVTPVRAKGLLMADFVVKAGFDLWVGGRGAFLTAGPCRLLQVEWRHKHPRTETPDMTQHSRNALCSHVRRRMHGKLCQAPQILGDCRERELELGDRKS